MRGHVQPQSQCEPESEALSCPVPSCPVPSRAVGPVLCRRCRCGVERFTHSSTAAVCLLLVRGAAFIYSSRARRAAHVETHLYTCQVASALLLLTTSLGSNARTRSRHFRSVVCTPLVQSSKLQKNQNKNKKQTKETPNKPKNHRFAQVLLFLHARLSSLSPAVLRSHHTGPRS